MEFLNPASTVFLALSAPGMGEWGVILILVLVLFGGKNIPDLARALGKGIREFKRATNGIGDSLDDSGSDKGTPSSGSSARPSVNNTQPSDSIHRANPSAQTHSPAKLAEPADRDRPRSE